MNKSHALIFKRTKGDSAAFKTGPITVIIPEDPPRSSRPYEHVNRHQNQYVSSKKGLNHLRANSEEHLIIYHKTSPSANRLPCLGLAQNKYFLRNSFWKASDAIERKSLNIGVRDLC